MKVEKGTHHSSPITHHPVRDNVPDLGYMPVPDIFKLPPGMNFGPCSSVAVNSKGNILVFNRSAHALMEFTRKGKYLRTLAQGIFTLPHGLRVDAEDNIWATDTGAHIVVKMDPKGRILMVLGVKGNAGEWHQAGHLRCFNEPNDLAFGPAGEIYITQGHGKGESRVHKFDAGGIGYTAAVQFNSMAGVKMLHVPYKGNAQAILDVMGGIDRKSVV